MVYKNNKNRLSSLIHRDTPIWKVWDEALESVQKVSWWFWPAARAGNHSFLVHTFRRVWKVYRMSVRSKLLDVSCRKEFYNLRKLFFLPLLLTLRHCCHLSGRWCNGWTTGQPAVSHQADCCHQRHTQPALERPGPSESLFQSYLLLGFWNTSFRLYSPLPSTFFLAGWRGFGKMVKLLAKVHLIHLRTARRFYLHIWRGRTKEKGWGSGRWPWVKRFEEGNLQLLTKQVSGGSNF